MCMHEWVLRVEAVCTEGAKVGWVARVVVNEFFFSILNININ
jgi:hypothetical protein